MLDELRDLYEYNRWANGRIRRASSSLPSGDFTRDLGNSFPSIRDTLVHIVSAEWIWLERWTGTSPAAMLDPVEFPTHAAVAERWRKVEHDQNRFLTGLSLESVQQVVEYSNTSGERWSYPLWQMMRHVVNHSTYHRGQVVTMLRQLGEPGVGTDLLLFYDTGDS